MAIRTAQLCSDHFGLNWDRVPEGGMGEVQWGQECAVERAPEGRAQEVHASDRLRRDLKRPKAKPGDGVWRKREKTSDGLPCGSIN